MTIAGAYRAIMNHIHPKGADLVWEKVAREMITRGESFLITQNLVYRAIHD